MLRSLAVLVTLAVPGLPAGPADAGDRFRVDRTTLIYDTETGPDPVGIHQGDVETLVGILRETEGLTTLRLNSTGGGYYAAFDLANVVIDFELDTEIVDECSSACAYVFLGGKQRTMWRGARLGFHRTYWDAENVESFFNAQRDERGWTTPFEFASWNYEDTQLEVYERLKFMTARGVSPGFAIETLRADSHDMWYPYRLHLIAAGVLTQ